MNTLHVNDLTSAAWVLAEWMAKEGRKEANVLAGEELPPNEKSKIKEGQGFNLPDHSTKPVAPLFNVVSFHSVIQITGSMH